MELYDRQSIVASRAQTFLFLCDRVIHGLWRAQVPLVGGACIGSRKPRHMVERPAWPSPLRHQEASGLRLEELSLSLVIQKRNSPASGRLPSGASHSRPFTSRFPPLP